MNPLNKFGNYIETLRDSRRPTLQDVVRVVEEAFEGFQINARKVMGGENGIWMWEEIGFDESMPKFYTVSQSVADGMVGYPLLTIRQAYSLKLDTWVTMSSIVPGPDAEGIAHSMSLLIAQHACAFAGVKYGSSTAMANKGHPHAAVLAATHLMKMEPLVVDDVDDEVADLLEERGLFPPKKDIN